MDYDGYDVVPEMDFDDYELYDQMPQISEEKPKSGSKGSKGSGGGNTKKPPREAPKVHWCFTLNNYEYKDLGYLQSYFNQYCKQYIFQEETGENGTPHLQGYIGLIKKSRLTELKHINTKIHWEPCIDVKASIVYCSKTESRSGEIYAKNITYEEKPDIAEPYGWQLEALHLIDTIGSENRKIFWIYSIKGGLGKTEFGIWLYANRGAGILEGKKNDILNCAMKYNRRIYIWDLERSMETFVSYAAIEKIKNGFYMNSKYETGMVLRKKPIVMIFANFPPDYSKLSEDRWECYQIWEGKLVKQTVPNMGTTVDD